MKKFLYLITAMLCCLIAVVQAKPVMNVAASPPNTEVTLSNPLVNNSLEGQHVVMKAAPDISRMSQATLCTNTWVQTTSNVLVPPNDELVTVQNSNGEKIITADDTSPGGNKLQADKKITNDQALIQNE